MRQTPEGLTEERGEGLGELGDAGATELAIAEARTIGHKLGCRPLLDRADATEPAQTRYKPEERSILP